MEESNTVEFKEILNKSILKEIIAFANTNGGIIYIGINDDGEDIGIVDAKQDQEKLSSMIRDVIRPSIVNYVDIRIKSSEQIDLLIVEVQRGDGKPYYLNDKGMKPSGVFKRLGNTSIPVSDQDIRKMIIDNHGTTYENTRSLEQNLTFQYAFSQFELRQIDLKAQQMKTLGFYDEDGLYNNLALLLSDQCPHIIKAAIFKGDDKSEFKHRQEFTGCLLKQLDDVYQFLEMQNHIDTSYERLRRVDHYDYSAIALREGLLNAIVHRDYGVGGSIFVNIFKSSCEFVSLGSLPNGIYIEDIYEGVSKPRNEKLARVFYRLELIEAYGTGIMKIMLAYKDASRKPEIRVTPGAFILRLPTLQDHIRNQIVSEPSLTYSMNNSDISNINLKNKESVLEDICRHISENGNITRLEIQKLYAFGQTKSGQLLKELEKREIIRKMGKGKSSYYVLSTVYHSNVNNTQVIDPASKRNNFEQ